MYQQNQFGLSQMASAEASAQQWAQEAQRNVRRDEMLMPRVGTAFEELDRAIRGLDEISQAVMERTQIVQRPATPEPAQVKEAGQIRGASSNLVITVEEAAARVRAISGRLQGVLDRLEI